ncbi:gamma-aminobutyric acid receptor subunit beta-3-like [Symsagittifera roscoffensis]|uniref:gamma-aminobutyric acid receptor subunit beta-3-like n=1 Tax=Symsagittifera roscoffensis TaxID=84072 RepID=UPI00307B9A0B
MSDTCIMSVVRYDLYVNLQWRDRRFRFDPRVPSVTFEHQSVERDEMLWVPTIYFPDGINAQVPDVMRTNIQVRVFSNGTIRYSSRAQLDNACVMFLGHFPLDVQHCELCVESYTHTVEEAEFHWRERGAVVFGERLRKYSELPMTAHFTVSNPSYNESIRHFDSGNYSRLCVNIVFERKLLHYILADYLPSGMIVCLSWVSFWVSPDLIPARASLSITTVLAIITLIGGTQQRFPSVSDLKALDIYYFMCFLYVFLCLLEFAAASYRAKRMPPNQKSIDVSLADIGAMALKMTAVSTIDEEDELGGMDIYPPEGTLRGPNASFGSQSFNGECSGNSGMSKGAAAGEYGNRNSASSNRLRFKRDNSMNSNKNGKQDNSKEDTSPFSHYETMKRLSLKHAKNLDKKARIFFPTTFIFFNLVYWTYYWWLRNTHVF